MLFRILLSILLGVLTTWALVYFNLFTHDIDVLIGVIVAIITYRQDRW